MYDKRGSRILAWGGYLVISTRTSMGVRSLYRSGRRENPREAFQRPQQHRKVRFVEARSPSWPTFVPYVLFVP